ncbi:MAG: hypothetical protein MUF84_20015 [Anaerolineae bacterium]|jgi:hypothetical protein|nr:hypothetical protein [Anaerolineae bacterium]
MKHAIPSTTRDLSLIEVVARLSANPRVKGVLQIGSLAEDTLTSASDYDLVIIHQLDSDPLPPWYVGITQIDRRLTDLIFVAATEVARLISLVTPVAPSDALAPIIRWVQHGTIAHDRTGLLQRAKQHLAARCWVEPIDSEAAHATWFSVNYNLAQTRRMIEADDPLYQATAEIRMVVYGYADVWHGYFTLRKLPWQGDKAAVTYLAEHDTAFLDAYRQFLAETSAGARLLAYQRAAAIATSVWGGLWPPDTTAMNIKGALATWQTLLEPEG